MGCQDNVLNVYNWTDYIDPAALEKFTAETGIKVRYDVFDSLETLEGKLLAGHSGYDIVTPSNEPTFSRLIQAGALAEIDQGKVANWKYLDPVLMRRVETSDPGNRHGAIYLWGTIGLGANVERIKSIAPDAPLDSWDLLFNPANAKRIAACGIVMMDSGDRCDPVGAQVSRPRSERQRARRSRRGRARVDGHSPLHSLLCQRRIALEALATGQSCLAFDYSGDVTQATSRAAEAKQGVIVQYLALENGAWRSASICSPIPADAPHKAAALAFIDFLLRPEVMAGITNVTHYPNAVPASQAMIADLSVFPPRRRWRVALH